MSKTIEERKVEHREELATLNKSDLLESAVEGWAYYDDLVHESETLIQQVEANADGLGNPDRIAVENAFRRFCGVVGYWNGDPAPSSWGRAAA